MKKNHDFDIGLKSYARKCILVCMLFLSMSFFPCPGWAQKQDVRLTLKMENVSLQSVFKAITVRTGYDFVYSSDLLANTGNVSVDVKDELLEKVLDIVLKETNLGYKIEEKHVIISPKLKRVESKKMETYTGIVKDKNGVTLPGVTVLLKGTSVGVISNEDGKFSITIPEQPDVIFLFSFVGMKKKEVAMKNQKPLDVILEEDVSEMDEVVVNGYFTQNKNSYTGSVTTIKSEEILAISSTNLFKALAILTPGLRIVENNAEGSNPNHIPEIIIRGTTSIASNGEFGLNSPLIILDGVEVSLQRLYDLDIFEIETVSVLKDASATAIYGEKAANGVIVVVRKRVTDSKLRVRYNFVPNIQMPDVSSFNLCNAAEKLEIERRYGKYNSPIGEFDELYHEKFKRVQSGVNTDWKSKPLRNSYSFDHSFSVTGRGSGMDYGLTARYSNTKGVMKGDFRNNYGFGVYFSYFYKGKLNISLRSDFSKTDLKNSPYGDFSDFVIINPYDVPKDEYGDWIKILSYRQRNPLYDAMTNSFNKSNNKSFSSSLDTRWDVFKGLYLTGTVNYTLSDGRNEVFDSPESSKFVGESNPAKRGEYAVGGSEGNSWAVQLAVNYSRTFDEDGTVLSLHAGGTANKHRSSNFSFSGMGFLKPFLTDINFATTYPSGHPSGNEDIGSNVGLFGNLNFIWRNKYFMDVSYRTSGSSSYGKDRRFSPFWAAGIGWNVHNEKFIKKLSYITTCRLRGSLGYTGSVNFADNQAVTTYRYDQNNIYYISIGANPITMGNDKLKWQTTLNYNLGLNLDVLEGRFGFTFDWYKQVTKDLLLMVSLPPSVGVTSLNENLGESRNWGYEWSVSAQLIQKKGFYWRVGLNGHHTENKVVKISNALKRQNDKNMGESGLVAPKIQFEEGESSTAIYAVRSLGIDPATGQEIFIKKDGSYTFSYDPTDKVALGNTTPKIEAGLTTHVSYKGFSVSAAMSFTFGGDIYNETRASKIENINPDINVDRRVFTERWKNVGDVVKYVNLSNHSTYAHTQRFVEEKNELYLSSVSIAYDFKSELVRHIGLSKLRLGVSFSDVLRLSTVKFERGTNYPYMRGYSFTISPTF